MKPKSLILQFLLCVTLFACTSSRKEQTTETIVADPLPSKYENEYFSLYYPKDWTYNDTKWGGMDSTQNEVDIYPVPLPGQRWEDMDVPCWIHCVKAFLNIQWKQQRRLLTFQKHFMHWVMSLGFWGYTMKKTVLLSEVSQHILLCI